jgi:hypothetical protein
VVNVEAEESDLARMSGRSLGERLRGATVQVPGAVDDVVADAYGGEGRRPVGGTALVAALAVLAAEGLVTRRRGAAGRARAAA